MNVEVSVRMVYQNHNQNVAWGVTVKSGGFFVDQVDADLGAAFQRAYAALLHNKATTK